MNILITYFACVMSMVNHATTEFPTEKITLNFLNSPTAIPTKSTSEKDHKYYVSVSNVKYSKKAKSLQMVTRFFIDDLQEVLNARNTVAVELGVVKEIQSHYPAIQRYLDTKLSIKIKDQTIAPNFLGAEYEGDQIVLYIEFKAEQAPTELEMTFNAFFEMFEDQKNLVHFKIKSDRKTLILDRSTPSDNVKF